MNYYENTINSFLSSVASNMSAVYLPAFFVSLIDQIIDSQLFEKRGTKIIRDMRDAQNIYPVFEKRCPILHCNKHYIQIDIVGVDTLLKYSIL